MKYGTQSWRRNDKETILNRVVQDKSIEEYAARQISEPEHRRTGGAVDEGGLEVGDFPAVDGDEGEAWRGAETNGNLETKRTANDRVRDRGIFARLVRTMQRLGTGIISNRVGKGVSPETAVASYEKLIISKGI